jgi:ribonuclease III
MPKRRTIEDSDTKIMNPLEGRLGYKFRNGLLLAEALTHPSLSLERRDFAFDNQRLEFLGDAVLQLVITEQLYRLFPDFSEGRLTKLRTRIVSRPALKQLALNLRLGECLMMGRGEESSGGRERASTLADAFESIVGAIYLDGGFDAARNFLLRVTLDEFERIADDPEEINPKGVLQEALQSIRPEAPGYETMESEGPAHSRVFSCRVTWNGSELGRGRGMSKKQAQVAAACDALERRIWEAPAAHQGLRMILSR